MANATFHYQTPGQDCYCFVSLSPYLSLFSCQIISLAGYFFFVLHNNIELIGQVWVVCMFVRMEMIICEWQREKSDPRARKTLLCDRGTCIVCKMIVYSLCLWGIGEWLAREWWHCVKIFFTLVFVFSSIAFGFPPIFFPPDTFLE